MRRRLPVAQLDADLTALGIPVTVHTVYMLTNVGGPIVIAAPEVSAAPPDSRVP